MHRRRQCTYCELIIFVVVELVNYPSNSLNLTLCFVKSLRQLQSVKLPVLGLLFEVSEQLVFHYVYRLLVLLRVLA